MIRYIRYSRHKLVSDFLGVVVWTALTTFMLVAKNAVGVNNIPIFEVLIFMSGLIGITVAHMNLLSFRLSMLCNIIIETVFLVILYYTLLTSSIAVSGIVVYCVIIVNVFIFKVIKETSRGYEDVSLTKQYHKQALKILRKKGDTLAMVGGVIGAGIGLVCLTYLKIDILIFTLYILVLNITQNMYDYYLWNKYLR